MEFGIKSEDISVVVQGVVHKVYTPIVLESIRKFLPKAEIILSTWEQKSENAAQNNNYNNLDYDIIVENKDPGAYLLFKKRYNNLNRQIVSTKNGIKAANRKYVLKIRTDISLKNANFLMYFNQFTSRNNNCKILSQRVITCNRFARLPETFPFHPSDWVFFGLKEDVEKIWDIPLAPEPETTNWFHQHELKPPHENPKFLFRHFRHRYCSEQYIWINLLKKYREISFEDMFDITPENIELTKLSFANNLVILSKEQYGIVFLKGDYNDNLDLYDYLSWANLFKKYCKPSIEELNFLSQTVQDYQFSIKKKFLSEKLKYHYSKLVNPFTSTYKKIKSSISSFFKWFSEIFSVSSYGLQFIFFIFSICLNVFIKEKINDFGKEIYFCGIPVIKDKRNKKTGLKERRILFFNFTKINIKSFFKNILKDVPQDADDIYILRQSTGEIYLLANTFETWVKNNGSKNPFIVYTREYHKEFFDLFCNQEYKGKYIPIKPCDFPYFNKVKHRYKGKNIYLYMDQKFLYDGHITKINKDKNASYVSPIFKHLKINNYEQYFKYPKIENSLKESVQKNYGNKKYVFICPKSYSISPVASIFWDKIKTKLDEKNIGYVFNRESLTIKEITAIAEQSLGIISVRTGVTEHLSSLHVPMFILYREAPRFKISAEKVINLYSLKKYPNVDESKIFEYEAENESVYDSIIDSIMKNLEALSNE